MRSLVVHSQLWLMASAQLLGIISVTHHRSAGTVGLNSAVGAHLSGPHNLPGGRAEGTVTPSGVLFL